MQNIFDQDASVTLDVTDCNQEPIHVPGAIQPHGALLVANRNLVITHGAGDIAELLGLPDWHGKSIAGIFGSDVEARIVAMLREGKSGQIQRVSLGRSVIDVGTYVSDDHVLIECEPVHGPRASSEILGLIEVSASALERAPTLKTLCEVAAAEFRKLTGYARVMVYCFLDDAAGVVLAEDRRPDLHSFLNHHFPASDIPQQARALYLRNLVRVIPDVHYEPALLEPAWTGPPLDMSDSALRSVSPVHLQYLKNMNVAASASVSIVKDGALWGLIACHNDTPAPMPYDTRAACRALGGVLSRQIRAREEAETYRERLRLRGYEDDIVSLLSREGALEDALSNHLDDLRRFLSADGVIVMRGGQIVTDGNCPATEDARALAAWLTSRSVERVFATDRLAQAYPDAKAFENVAAGVLAVTLSMEDQWILIWLRAEEVQVVEWAGNPHDHVNLQPGEALSPRASFQAWQETVRGRSRRWTPSEVEAGEHIRQSLIEARQNRRIRDLNRQLLESLDEKDLLLSQKQFLIGEVNHRVQNSLQLVSSFLALQSKNSKDNAFNAAIGEARRRISAVSLVHRRLYRGDHVGVIDTARYIEELCNDLGQSMGDAWARNFSLDLAPVMLSTDRAVTLGLVLTELIININKYAYDGEAGSIDVVLSEDRNRFRLTVADRGRGKVKGREGFGSRMINALVGQLAGELQYVDNKPGLRAVLVAPMEAPQ